MGVLTSIIKLEKDRRDLEFQLDILESVIKKETGEGSTSVFTHKETVEAFKLLQDDIKSLFEGLDKLLGVEE